MAHLGMLWVLEGPTKMASKSRLEFAGYSMLHL